MDQEKITEGSILIAHLADTHLRDTQYATARRGLDFFEAAKQAVTKACDEADLLVLVGDIFDRPRPSPRVIGQLMELHSIIRCKNKVCLAVTGNHDWCEPTWLSTLFPHSESGIVPLDGKSITFGGFEFAGIIPHNAGTFRRDIVATENMARGADVVLYHGFVDGVVPFYAGLQDPLHVGELPIQAQNKAWLLGDIHVQGYRAESRPGGGTCIVGYPGSTEMCSSSEDPEKGVPLIRVSQEAATLEKVIPIDTRPFIRAIVEDQEQLDKLVAQVEKVADQHPVLHVEFSRELPETITRLHALVDAQRGVIRCYPLPDTKAFASREASGDQEEELGMQHFVEKRFKDREDLCKVAVDLLHRGDDDAHNITTDFVEGRMQKLSREED